MRERLSVLDDNACWRECEQLGVARVRAMLRRQDMAEPQPGWRGQAQLWLDARLRRQGEYAYRGVLAAIAVLCGVIACMTWWRW